MAAGSALQYNPWIWLLVRIARVRVLSRISKAVVSFQVEYDGALTQIKIEPETYQEPFRAQRMDEGPGNPPLPS